MLKGAKKEEKHNVISTSKKFKSLVAPLRKKPGATARIRKIGNSKGILLSNSMIKALGIEDETEVIVTTESGRIIITPVKSKRKINTDLSSWEAQFKAAIKNGDNPEPDMFEGMENTFDKEEW